MVLLNYFFTLLGFCTFIYWIYRFLNWFKFELFSIKLVKTGINKIYDWLKKYGQRAFGVLSIIGSIIFLIIQTEFSGYLDGNALVTLGIIFFGISLISKNIDFKASTLFLSLSIIIASASNYILFGNLSPENMSRDMLIAWIGYIGAVFGGLIAYITFISSIEHQNKQRAFDEKQHKLDIDHELSIKYRPLLQCESIKFDINDGGSLSKNKIHITFKNVGRGEITKINVTAPSVSTYYNIFNIHCDKSVVPINELFEISFELSKKESIDSIFSQSDNDPYHFSLQVYDLVDNVLFNQINLSFYRTSFFLNPAKTKESLSINIIDFNYKDNK